MMERTNSKFSNDSTLSLVQQKYDLKMPRVQKYCSLIWFNIIDNYTNPVLVLTFWVKKSLKIEPLKIPKCYHINLNHKTWSKIFIYSGQNLIFSNLLFSDIKSSWNLNKLKNSWNILGINKIMKKENQHFWKKYQANLRIKFRIRIETVKK